MFNIGPMELMVLAIIGLIVLGPDRLPGLAKDAANLIRTLRDMATGAREQLRDELGPEFADVDLRNLNPRTAVQRAVFGEDFNFGKLNPRTAVRDAVFGDEDLRAADPRALLRETHDEIRGRGNTSSDVPVKPVSMAKDPARPPTTAANGARPRPRPRPAPATSPYDDDAT